MVHDVWVLAAGKFPRPSRRGLIEATRKVDARLSTLPAISAAFTPRPH